MMDLCCDKAVTSPGAAGERVRACWIGNRVLVPEGAPPQMPAGPLVVTPWNVRDGVPAGPSLRATSRDVTAGGISFAHDGLLACRFAAVSRRTGEPSGPPVETILVRLLWCRFTGGGYLSGGRVERTLGDEFDDGSRGLESLAATNGSAPVGRG